MTLEIPGSLGRHAAFEFARRPSSFLSQIVSI